MKPAPVITAILLVLNTAIFAQLPALPLSNDGIITGKVEDSKEHAALEYANVVLYRINDSAMVTGVITDASGHFELKGIANGTYYIYVNFIGYNKTKISGISISKENSKADLGTISLQQSASDLGGVEVSSEKQEVQYKIDKKVINVSKNITASGGSAVDALRNVPSVNVDAEGNVTLRGSSNYTVLVDGRPTPQSSSDVLRQTPASAIENIEVITNPSAKYDPDGTAGIINIIMKKNSQHGINGIVNASYQTFDKYSADFQLNCRTGKFNFFGGAEYRNRIDRVTQIINKTIFDKDTSYVTLADVKQQYHRWNYRLNAGADWNVNEHNTFTFSGTYLQQEFNIASPVFYHILTDPVTSDTWLDMENDMDIRHHWWQGNLYYTHTFGKPGHTLGMNASYNNWAGKKSDEQLKNITGAGWTDYLSTEYKRRRFFDNDSWRASGDIDYTLPISEKTKFEAGYSGDQTRFASDYRVEFWDPDFEQWNNDTSLSNGFIYSMGLHALYATLSGELWGIGYQLGMRGEYYDRSLRTQSPDSVYKMDIWSLFPTLHLSRQFKNGHQLQFSYSRRVNRPDIMALTPLPYFSDEFLIHSGNPALRPEYGNSFELNYQKIFGQSSLSVETYYRYTRDLITQIIKVNPGQTVTTNANMNNDWAAGITLGGNFTVGKILKIGATADGFRYHLEGDFSRGVASREAYTANVRLSTTFIFKTGTFIQVTGAYNTPSQDAAGKLAAFGSLDVAVKQDFFKKKLSVTLTAGNLFGLAHYDYEDHTAEYLSDFSYIPEPNTFGITLSYKINNYTRRNHPNEGNGSIDVGF